MAIETIVAIGVSEAIDPSKAIERIEETDAIYDQPTDRSIRSRRLVGPIRLRRSKWSNDAIDATDNKG